MEKKCKNCLHFEKVLMTSLEYSKNIGICRKEAESIFECNETRPFAIMCGHDGPIYFNENFGCILFEAKE